MKPTVTAFAAAVAIALGTAAIEARQATTQTTPQKKTPPEVTLTGCIVQGSGPTVFIFDNARKDPDNAVEKGVRYIVVSAAEDLDLRAHLNHQVRIVGEVDLKVATTTTTPATPPSTPPVPPDPQRPADERTLPKLSAKSVTMVSDTCSLVR